MNRNLERRRNTGSLFGIDPFGTFPTHRDILGNFLNNGFGIGGLSDVFQSDFGVKVVNADNAKEYHFGLPGIEKENITVDVSDNVLEVSVAQEDDKQTRTYVSKVVLSPDVDVSKATAESRNGLLIVSIPYAEKHSMKIPVSGGNENQGAIGVNESSQNEVTQGETENREVTEQKENATIN